MYWSKESIKIHCFGEPLFRERTQWVGVAFEEGSVWMSAVFCLECRGRHSASQFDLPDSFLGERAGWKEGDDNVILWWCTSSYQKFHIREKLSIYFYWVWATNQGLLWNLLCMFSLYALLFYFNSILLSLSLCMCPDAAEALWCCPICLNWMRSTLLSYVTHVGLTAESFVFIHIARTTVYLHQTARTGSCTLTVSF